MISNKKKFFRKGSEILGFLYVLPLIFLILYLFIAMFQLGFLSQSLHHAAYKAARAAVVCKTADEAETQAISAAKASVGQRISGVNPDDIEVSLSIKDNSEWKKGAFVEVEIQTQIESFFPQINSMKSQVVTMMVERPAKGEDEEDEEEDPEIQDENGNVIEQG